MAKRTIKQRANTKTKSAKKLVKKKTYKRNVLDSLKISKIPRVRKELVDADYLNQLSPNELQWYAKFIDEYVGANVKKYKKARKGEKVRRVKKGHLHKSQELAKSVYDSNNRRNNDVYGVTRANNILYDINGQEDGWYITNANLTEDAIIARIDNGDSMPAEFNNIDLSAEELHKSIDNAANSTKTSNNPNRKLKD